MSLESQELDELKSKIGRDPTSTELQIVAAEWSEHCSYKSSKRHLKMLPMTGPLVITEKGSYLVCRYSLQTCCYSSWLFL